MKKVHSIDFVFVLLLLCTFAISILMVLMNGVKSYEAVTGRMENNYNSRTGIAYVTEKLRHCGEYAEIELAELQTEDEFSDKNSEIRSLKISQMIEGERYATYIYYYDGFLRELFTNEGNVLPPETGSKIVEMKSFDVNIDNEELLNISCEMPDGSLSSSLIHIEGSFKS